jgi:hypothetical protein
MGINRDIFVQFFDDRQEMISRRKPTNTSLQHLLSSITIGNLDPLFPSCLAWYIELFGLLSMASVMTQVSFTNLLEARKSFSTLIFVRHSPSFSHHHTFRATDLAAFLDSLSVRSSCVCALSFSFSFLFLFLFLSLLSLFQ